MELAKKYFLPIGILVSFVLLFAGAWGLIQLT